MMDKRQQSVGILYEDEDICVCRKPAGLACESARASQPDIVKELKVRYFLQNPNGKEHKVWLVHRLDQPVGGLLVLARNQKAAAVLSRQIAAHTLEKGYLAVTVSDQPIEHLQGKLADYLLRDGKQNRSFVVSEKEAGAKKAELSYQVLGQMQTERGYEALVNINLFTGRHHQIRVQMASHGMPLLFDQKYNTAYQGGADGNTALYAFHLVFQHPSKHRRMEFIDLPEGEPFVHLQKFFPACTKNC